MPTVPRAPRSNCHSCPSQPRFGLAHTSILKGPAGNPRGIPAQTLSPDPTMSVALEGSSSSYCHLFTTRQPSPAKAETCSHRHSRNTSVARRTRSPTDAKAAKLFNKLVLRSPTAASSPPAVYTVPLDEVIQRAIQLLPNSFASGALESSTYESEIY